MDKFNGCGARARMDDVGVFGWSEGGGEEEEEGEMDDMVKRVDGWRERKGRTRDVNVK